MKPARVVFALIAAPLVGALFYTAAVGIDGIRFSGDRSGNELLTTFLGMAVLALVFEMVVLFPAAVFLRGRQRFAVNLLVVGVLTWLALVAVCLVALGLNALSVAITSAQLLLLGVPVVLTFVGLVRKGLHA